MTKTTKKILYLLGSLVILLQAVVEIAAVYEMIQSNMIPNVILIVGIAILVILQAVTTVLFFVKPKKKNDKKTGDVQSQETPPSESSIDRAQALQTGTENTSTGKEINEVPEEGYGEPNESEMNDWDYSHAQRKFKDGEQLDKDDQLQFIRNGRCPKCGKTQLVQKVSKNGNTYTKCQDYNCGYWFMGTRNDPKIYKEYENGVTPLGSK